jgi:hypothetical protein
MTWIVIAGYLASALVFATFCVRTMIPLRLIAISSNVAFIVYGFYGGIYPVLVLHVILLPMGARSAIVFTEAINGFASENSSYCNRSGCSRRMD